MPKSDVSWCAFGVTRYDPLNFPVLIHRGEEDGYSVMYDHENIDVLVSFYGPGHVDQARQLRRSLHIYQNRLALRKNGLAFLRAGTIVAVPELVAMQWEPRADIPLTFQLLTRQIYAILNIKQVAGTVQTDASSGLFVPIGCRACSRDCWKQTQTSE